MHLSKIWKKNCQDSNQDAFTVFLKFHNASCPGYSTIITPRKLRARLPTPKHSQNIYTLTHNQDVQTILGWQFLINYSKFFSWCSHLNFQQIDRSRNYFIILWAASAKKEKRRYFLLEVVRVQLISHTGLLILYKSNRQGPVTLSTQTWLFFHGHNLFWDGQILTVFTVAIVNPDLYSNPFVTKKQPNPSGFRNKNYKLIVLPLLVFRTLQQKLRTWIIIGAARLIFVRMLSDHSINLKINHFI